MWTFLLRIIVWESIKGSGSEEGFMLRELYGDLQKSLLFCFFLMGDSNGGGARVAGHGDCVGGCCCVTSATGCCDSAVMLGYIHCFFSTLVSPLSLCLFRFVEVSISSGCSVFFFLFDLLEGDEDG